MLPQRQPKIKPTAEDPERLVHKQYNWVIKREGQNLRLTDEGEGTVTGNDRFTIYKFGPALDTVIGISPRVKWNIDPVTIAGEIEYTRASFGQVDAKAKICDAVPVDNVRFTIAVTYHF